MLTPTCSQNNIHVNHGEMQIGEIKREEKNQEKHLGWD
jgi:hypothetical protein